MTERVFDSLRDDLERIRTARRAARRRYYRPSKLEPHRKTLEDLRGLGASLEDLRIWLQRKAGLEISKSAVSRAFKRWGMERAS